MRSTVTCEQAEYVPAHEQQESKGYGYQIEPYLVM